MLEQEEHHHDDLGRTKKIPYGPKVNPFNLANQKISKWHCQVNLHPETMSSYILKAG